jgi:hypothetical protein
MMIVCLYRFWAHLAGATEKSKMIETIIPLARSKLICQHDIHGKATDTARTAVLDVLLMLDFEPRREAAHMILADMVASHMRTVFSVPKHREYFCSGYPSEPILAEAAARQLHEFQKHSHPSQNVMVTILRECFSSGLLHQGHQGEVVTRLLVMTAYMRAVKTDHSKDSSPHFSKGCKLTTFIGELFQAPFAEEILHCVPDNLQSRTTFAEAFKKAVVRFTHFGKMADDSGATAYAMLAAFIRGMAIICWDSQDFVDILIPILLDDTADVQQSAMSGLLLQVKRRKTGGSVGGNSINEKSLQFFPNDETDARPYVTLVAELGLQLPIAPAAETRAKVVHSLAEEEPPKARKKPKTGTDAIDIAKLYIPQQPGRIHHARTIHPRYAIFSYGCSNTVYKVINESEKNEYQYLLATRNFLGEHSRIDVNSLKAVRRMKPFWSIGPDCYGWLDEQYLQAQEYLQDEKVLLGTYRGDEDYKQPAMCRSW